MGKMNNNTKILEVNEEEATTKVIINGQELTINHKADIFMPSLEFRLMRDDTIKKLGYESDSREAQVITDMTNAFLAQGIDRGAEIANAMKEGTMSIEDFANLVIKK